MNGKNQEKNEYLNVLGQKLDICSCKPLTGWYRDGFCRYDSNDGGNHSICCVMAVSYTHLTLPTNREV